MRSLLDVNVLIALFDAGHLHHEAAHRWLAAHVHEGWASCPLTQNGCLRLLSQPRYANAQPLALVAERLSRATQDDSHEFWPDAFSLIEPGRLRWDHALASRQLTDLYLLALAVSRGGRFVTLDRGITPAAVPGAEARHLMTLWAG